jgi:hypothetical protein
LLFVYLFVLCNTHFCIVCSRHRQDKSYVSYKDDWNKYQIIFGTAAMLRDSDYDSDVSQQDKCVGHGSVSSQKRCYTVASQNQPESPRDGSEERAGALPFIMDDGDWIVRYRNFLQRTQLSPDEHLYGLIINPNPTQHWGKLIRSLNCFLQNERSEASGLGGELPLLPSEANPTDTRHSQNLTHSNTQ